MSYFKEKKIKTSVLSKEKMDTNKNTLLCNLKASVWSSQFNVHVKAKSATKS